MPSPFDPRRQRLLNDWQKLQKLNAESDTVRVDPHEWVPGGPPPEKFWVTFKCKGIVGIDSEKNPIYGFEHKVFIECHNSYPKDPPRLSWESPSWHPNIGHTTKSVCINPYEWLGGQTLVGLIKMLFDMVQYRNYHATDEYPRPLDGVVAKWVLEFAEPNRIVSKAAGIPVDDKPFTRPTTVPASAAPTTVSPRVRVLVPAASSAPPTTPNRIRRLGE